MSVLTRARRFLEERFGIEIPPYYELIVRKDVWITNASTLNFELDRFERKGIRLLRVHGNSFKLTTAGAQLLGKLARKNIAELESFEDVRKIVMGFNVPYVSEGLERGQVIVTFQGDIVGVALYNGKELKSQIPSGRRIELVR